MLSPQEKRRQVARLRMKIGEDRRQLNSTVKNASNFGMTPDRAVTITNLKASIARRENELDVLRYF